MKRLINFYPIIKMGGISFLLFCLFPFKVSSQNFSKLVVAELPPLTNSKIQWVDFNNDGLLDIFLSGTTSVADLSTTVYINNGNATFDQIQLEGLTDLAVDFADYNSDGFLDILIAGINATNIKKTIVYENNNGLGFTPHNFSLIGLSNGGIIWQDLDMDGDFDILISGLDIDSNPNIKVYRYENNSYELLDTILPNVSAGQLMATDFNNDDFIEVLITGLNDLGNPLTMIYTVDKELNFTIYNDQLTNSAFNNIAVGDLNVDGFNDLVIAGLTQGSLSKETLLLVNNAGNGFVAKTTDFVDVSSASVSIGDINNDGINDIIIAGIDNDGIKHFKYYQNSPDFVLTEIPHVMENIFNGDVSLGDYENDGDLDILQSGNSDIQFQTNLFLSDQQSTIQNASPSVPLNLSAITTADSVYFSWDLSTDDFTNQNSLTYNIYVSELPNSDNLILSSQSDITTGFLRIPQLGNAGFKNNKALTRLPEGRYYWSVQSMDNGFLTSPFAIEQSFAICYPIDIGDEATICVEEDISFDVGTIEDEVNWYSKTNGLLAANSNTFNFQVFEDDTIIVELIKPFNCQVTDTLIIKASIPTQVDLGEDFELCLGEEYTFQVSETYDSVNWYKPKNLILANSIQYLHQANKKDTLIVEVFNADMCHTYDTVIIDVLPLPEFSIGSDTSICFQENIQLQVGADWNAVQWFNTRNADPISEDILFEHQAIEKDTIVAQITDSNLCVNTDSVIIDILALPIIDLGLDTAICYNENILLEVEDNGNTINWFTTTMPLVESSQSVLWNVIKRDTVIVQSIDTHHCTNYDSIIVDFLPLPIFEIGQDTAICQNDQILLQVGSGFDEVNWYSKTANEIAYSNSWFFNYTVINTDTLIAEVYSSDRCVNFDTIAIKKNELPLYSLGVDQSICFGDSLELEVPANWPTITWYTSGDLILEDQLFNYKLKVEEDIIIWTEVISEDNCIALDTVNIAVLSLPEFELGLDRQYCFGDTVNFQVPTIGDSYFWTNQQGELLSENNSLSFIASESLGIKLNILNDNGCEFQDSIAVEVNELPEFNISGLSEICQYENNQLSMDIDQWNSIIWYSSTDTLLQNTNEISWLAEQTNTLFAKLTDDNNCSFTDSINVIVNPRPTAFAGQDTLLCFGESIQLGTSYEHFPNLTFEWWPPATLNDPNIATPIATPIEPTNYVFKLITDKGCFHTDTAYVEVNPQITIEAGLNTAICLGDSIQLGGSPTASGSKFEYQYQWSPSTGLSDTETANPWAFPTEETQYSLFVISGRCTVEYDSVIISIHSQPQIEVINRQSIGAGDSVQLYAAGGVNFEWSPGRTLNNANIQSPMASPSITTTYTVEITDENGCSESGVVTVLVQNTLFIPSLFTPNNDGNNDTFRVFGSGVKNIQFTVFDQNGNKVFKSNNWEELAEVGWNGNYNGNPLKNDVYFWTIEGEFHNGEKLSYNGNQSGLIKLLK